MASLFIALQQDLPITKPKYFLTALRRNLRQIICIHVAANTFWEVEDLIVNKLADSQILA